MKKITPQIIKWLALIGLFSLIISCGDTTVETDDETGINPELETRVLSITIISGTGLVTASPSGSSCGINCYSYSSDTAVTLSANPGTDFTFSGWGGNCSGSGSCNVMVNQTRSVLASFSSTSPSDAGELFPVLSSTGSVTVTLHPGSAVVANQPTLVAFGVPFPRKLVSDVSTLRLSNVSGAEITSHVQELNRWRSLSGDVTVDSVRSALFYVQVSFPDSNPLTISVEYGTSRTPANEMGPQADPKTTWSSISNSNNFPSEYPAIEGIQEPKVYAALPPDWLGMTLLRTRTTSSGTISNFQWLDTATVNFSLTAVNDVSDFVNNSAKINYIDNAAPWLFDRAMTLYGEYIRTGAVKWLRHAHRATQFYSKHLSATGYFDLKTYDDLKYSYGQSMLLDLMLTGDTSLLAPIRRVAAATATWPETYSTSLNFWTERHQTYALLGALSAWEATGESAYANRVTEIVNASINQAQNPANGWAVNGCMLHTVRQHEGDANDDPICSPWMSALFADAMWRYYLHSEDPNALSFLANLGDYVRLYALYDGTASGDTSLAGTVMPWYMASSVTQITDSGPWADWEHTCDVAGLVAKAAWARARLNGNADDLKTTTNDLIASCESNLNNWHRPGSDVSAGLPEWRLAPPRKYNWWFGATSDISWLVNNVQ